MTVPSDWQELRDAAMDNPHWEPNAIFDPATGTYETYQGDDK